MITKSRIDFDGGGSAVPVSPLVDPVVTDVVGMIRRGKLSPGRRVPTIRALAKKHAVSFGTARAAMGYLERAGIVERHQGSGTYVKQLRAKSSAARASSNENAGGVMPMPWACLVVDTRTHVLGEFNVHLTNRLLRAGVIGVHLAPEMLIPAIDIENLLPAWRTHRPRALVIHRFMSSELSAKIEQSCAEGTRIIRVFREPHSTDVGTHSVEPNLPAAYRMATEHLIARGHRRIGVVTKGRLMQKDWAHTRRKASMMHTQQILAVGHALREAGIHDGLTIHYNQAVDGDPSGIPVDEANLARMAQWLNSDRRPTAIIADDYRAIGLKRAALRVGLRIPQDLEIVGIGGTPLAIAGDFPSVSLRYDLVAERLAELILADEESLRGAEHHIVIAPEFLTSDSKLNTTR